MTRVNVIPVTELSRQHLIAEWKEIGRVYGLVERAIAKGKTPDDLNAPPAYTLGKGHVTFFYNKLRFIIGRQLQLYHEMRRRGYRPSFKPYNSLDILARVGYLECMGDYTPTEEAMALNRERIKERLNG